MQPNQLDGTTQFNILVTDGDNDPPVIALPLPPTTPEDIAITLSGANAIRITDADAFLNDGELQVVLTATNGTFSLNAAALARSTSPTTMRLVSDSATARTTR